MDRDLGGSEGTPGTELRAACLRDFLADRDISCPVCRYNLRNVRTPACPECGDPLVLNVSRRAPKRSAYIGVVFPLLYFMVISVIATVVAFQPALKSTRISTANVAIAGGLTLTSAAGVAILLANKRSLLRKPLEAIQTLRWWAWGGLVLWLLSGISLFWLFGEPPL